MNILIRNQDSLVMYASEKMFLGDAVYLDDFSDQMYNIDNSQMIKVEYLPDNWFPMVYTYIDDKFEIADVELYNSNIAYIRKTSIPQTISPRQTRLALLQATLLDEVELMLANDKAMQIWWEYSLDIERNHEHIISMGSALGLTETQLDDLFILAGTL